MQLRELQDRFQRAIIAGDDAVLSEIMPGARERPELLLGVYRDWYVNCLVKVLCQDHDAVHAYLGDLLFEKMAREYVAAFPSHHPTVRWYAQHLPQFLRETASYSSRPELADLALLEQKLKDASDAEDAPVLQLADLATIPPEAWPRLRFKTHPSAARLKFGTNAVAIWIALEEHMDPPAVSRLRSPEHVLVFRHQDIPSFRRIGNEEAGMWGQVSKGLTFSAICEVLEGNDPDAAASRAAGYLQGWISSSLLSSAT